jgi:hypothetical protein
METDEMSIDFTRDTTPSNQAAAASTGASASQGAAVLRPAFGPAGEAPAGRAEPRTGSRSGGRVRSAAVERIAPEAAALQLERDAADHRRGDRGLDGLERGATVDDAVEPGARSSSAFADATLVVEPGAALAADWGSATHLTAAPEMRYAQTQAGPRSVWAVCSQQLQASAWPPSVVPERLPPASPIERLSRCRSN